MIHYFHRKRYLFLHGNLVVLHFGFAVKNVRYLKTNVHYPNSIANRSQVTQHINKRYHA